MHCIFSVLHLLCVSSLHLLSVVAVVVVVTFSSISCMTLFVQLKLIHSMSERRGRARGTDSVTVFPRKTMKKKIASLGANAAKGEYFMLGNYSRH